MKPVFEKDGVVTAGNSSGPNDSATALVLASEEAVKKYNLMTVARFVSYGFAGVEPHLVGIGSVPAAQVAMARAGLRTSAIDVIEAIEAFAVQACAVTRLRDLNPERVNPHGSGMSTGHPIGAARAINSTKALHQLQRTGGSYAPATVCIGGRQ